MARGADPLPARLPTFNGPQPLRGTALLNVHGSCLRSRPAPRPSGRWTELLVRPRARVLARRSPRGGAGLDAAAGGAGSPPSRACSDIPARSRRRSLLLEGDEYCATCARLAPGRRAQRLPCRSGSRPRTSGGRGVERTSRTRAARPAGAACAMKRAPGAEPRRRARASSCSIRRQRWNVPARARSAFESAARWHIGQGWPFAQRRLSPRRARRTGSPRWPGWPARAASSCCSTSTGHALGRHRRRPGLGEAQARWAATTRSARPSVEFQRRAQGAQAARQSCWGPGQLRNEESVAPAAIRKPSRHGSLQLAGLAGWTHQLGGQGAQTSPCSSRRLNLGRQSAVFIDDNPVEPRPFRAPWRCPRCSGPTGRGDKMLYHAGAGRALALLRPPAIRPGGPLAPHADARRGPAAHGVTWRRSLEFRRTTGFPQARDPHPGRAPLSQANLSRPGRPSCLNKPPTMNLATRRLSAESASGPWAAEPGQRLWTLRVAGQAPATPPAWSDRQASRCAQGPGRDQATLHPQLPRVRPARSRSRMLQRRGATRADAGLGARCARPLPADRE
jgi:hypothetical protein